MNKAEIQVFLDELTLWSFNNLDEKTMIEIFGDFPGKHLWAKYKELDTDFLRWHATLDIDNRIILSEYLEKIGLFE